MLFHSSINAFLSCARVAGGFRRFLTLLSSSSHMCSIGVKSGLYGGHASGAMLLFARKSWQTRATCGRALSCCRIRLLCCTSGTATGHKILSLYLTAVILPAKIINCDFIPWAMPPQTITEPSPNRSRSTTQASAKRSPRRRYTRRRPSARQRVNLALVNSIQKRIRTARAARGGHTRYWFSVWFWFQDLGGSYQWTSITRGLLITNQWNLELLFHTCTVL